MVYEVRYSIDDVPVQRRSDELVAPHLLHDPDQLGLLLVVHMALERDGHRWVFRLHRLSDRLTNALVAATILGQRTLEALRRGA